MTAQEITGILLITIATVQKAKASPSMKLVVMASATLTSFQLRRAVIPMILYLVTAQHSLSLGFDNSAGPGDGCLPLSFILKHKVIVKIPKNSIKNLV